MLEAATVTTFSLSVAFQAIPLAAMRTPAVIVHNWDFLYIYKSSRKMTHCQFLAIDHSKSSQTVSFPWWKKERRAHGVWIRLRRVPSLNHGYPGNQVSRYPGAYILQMVCSWNVSLIRELTSFTGWIPSWKPTTSHQCQVLSKISQMVYALSSLWWAINLFMNLI